MIIYHGTMDRYAQDICDNGIKLSKSKKYLDFGRGFYTTPSLEFARLTANLRAEKNNGFNRNQHARPAIVTLELNETLLTEVSYLRFEDCDVNWARFVVNNRLGRTYIEQYGETFHNIDKRYDIVSGGVADGRVARLDDLAETERIDITEELVRSILPRDEWGEQISIHTRTGMTCINVIGYDII